MEFCATVLCVPEDFFTSALCLLYSFIHLRLIYQKIACKGNFQNAGNSCRKSHVILSCFMQPVPGLVIRRLSVQIPPPCHQKDFCSLHAKCEPLYKIRSTFLLTERRESKTQWSFLSFADNYDTARRRQSL